MDGFILFNLGSASNVSGEIGDAEALGRALEYAVQGLYPSYKEAFLAFLNLMEDDEDEEEKIREYLQSLDKLNRQEMEAILNKYEFKIMRTP